jgi:VWFA-related protein
MKVSHKLFVSFSTILSVVAFLLHAQEYEVSITTINVWVKAVDKSGNPVRGLKQEDFSVYEDDRRMDLTCFEEVESGKEPVLAGRPETAEVQADAPAVANRKLVLFLDLYNTSPIEYKDIRPSIQSFLNQIKPHNWEVMIAALTPAGKMGIVAPFTKDLDAIARSLDKAPSNAKRDLIIKTAKSTITNTLEQAVRGPNEVDGRIFDDVVKQAFSLAQGYAKEERSVALFSLAALESFGAELGKREGNEHTVMLYVSGGFNADPGRQYFDAIVRFIEWAGFGGNPMEVNFRYPNSVKNFNFDLRKEIKDSIGRLNRNNITLYALNTRGLTSPGSDNTGFNIQVFRDDNSVLGDFQDSMIEIAKETGGLSFFNSRNFKLGLDQVLQDINQYYVICFNAPEHKQKGKYHEIKVNVKRDDIRIRHRKGYVD